MQKKYMRKKEHKKTKQIKKVRLYLTNGFYKEHIIMETVKTAVLSKACKMAKLRKKLPVQLYPLPSYPGLHVQL